MASPVAFKGPKAPLAGQATWRFDFEDYDSDDSVHSFASVNHDFEDELAAIDVETGFKARRAEKMLSDYKSLCGKLNFEESRDVTHAIKLIRSGKNNITLSEVFKKPEFIQLLSASATCFSLRISKLTGEGIGILANILKVNTSIRLIEVKRLHDETESDWDTLAEKLEHNYSLLFLVLIKRDEDSPESFDLANRSFALERVKKNIYRNQQICQLAFKRAIEAGETGESRHAKITVLGGSKAGKSSVMRCLFNQSSPERTEVGAGVKMEQAFVTPVESGNSDVCVWSILDIEKKPQQFSREFGHRVAARNVNDFLELIRRRRPAEIKPQEPLESTMEKGASRRLGASRKAPTAPTDPPAKLSRRVKPATSSNKFSLSPMKLFGRISGKATQAQPSANHEANSTAAMKGSELETNSVYSNSKGERETPVNDLYSGIFSVTSSMLPTTGDRTVVDKNAGERLPLSAQLNHFFKAVDAYQVSPSSPLLRSFSWSDFYDFTVCPDKTRLTIFDFSGDRAYRAAHEIFLSDAGINMVVVDLEKLADLPTRDEQVEDLLFWLESSKQNSPKCDIFIVGTHAHTMEAPFSLADANDLISKAITDRGFQVIKHKEGGRGMVFFPVDCTAIDTFSILRPALSEAVLKWGKKSAAEKVPGYWFSIIDSLVRMVDVKCKADHELTECRSFMLKPRDLEVRLAPSSPRCMNCGKNTVNAKRWFRCFVCETDLCENCHKRAIKGCLKDERVSPSVVTVSQFFQKCSPYRVSPEECRQMLEYFSKQRLLMHFDGSQVLTKYIVLKPKWIMHNIAKVVIDDSAHGERLIQTQTESLEKVSLQGEFERMLDEGVASQDLLRYLWGGNKNKFFIDLLKRYMLLQLWSVAEEKHFIVFSMIKQKTKREFYEEVVTSDLEHLDLDEEETRMATGFFTFKTNTPSHGKLPVLKLFERISCLAVDHSRSVRQTTFSTARTPEPELVQGLSRIFFTEHSPVYLEKVSDDTLAFKVLSTAKHADVVLNVLQAIVRQLNVETMKSSLSWTIEFTRGVGVNARMISMKSAQKLGLAPWFEEKENDSEPPQSGSAGFLESAVMNLDDFINN